MGIPWDYDLQCSGPVRALFTAQFQQKAAFWVVIPRTPIIAKVQILSPVDRASFVSPRVRYTTQQYSIELTVAVPGSISLSKRRHMPSFAWNTMLHSTSSIANIPFRERVTCMVPEALRVTGLGRTKLYELIGQESLRTFKIGRRRLIVVESLLSLIPETGSEPRHPV